jgi:hypothetical protein
MDIEQLAAMPGVQIIRAADVPPSMLDALTGVATVGAFVPDELPAGFEGAFGSGPGVTILVLDDKPAPPKAVLPIRALVAAIEGAVRIQATARRDDRMAAGLVDEELVASLLELAATPPTRASELRKKAACLRRHLDVTLHPIAREMIEAALVVDADGWGRGKTGH